jgi:hypothetical protein
MVETGIAAVSRTTDGWIMRRVIVIAAAGLSLAGCSSFSWDAFKSTPPAVQVQLESTPPGADARTSLGPGCKTPCVVSITPPEGSDFTVTYTMDKFQPATVPAHVIRTPGDFASSGTIRIDPNPIVAELQPMAPPRKPARKMHRPRRPKPPKGAAAPPAAASPFPAPAQAPAAAPPPAAASPPAPPTAAH